MRLLHASLLAFALAVNALSAGTSAASAQKHMHTTRAKTRPKHRGWLRRLCGTEVNVARWFSSVGLPEREPDAAQAPNPWSVPRDHRQLFLQPQDQDKIAAHVTIGRDESEPVNDLK